MGYHLFLTPDYGLCNRLRGYVGAYAYAKKQGCTLHVLWTRSRACPYSIEELFEPLPNTRFITVEERHATTYDVVTSDVGDLPEILTKNGLSPLNAAQIAPILIASLRPVAAIRDQLRGLKEKLALSTGLHIRRTDHVAFAEQHGGSTPLETFWEAILAGPDRPVYLACDDPATLTEAVEKYGSRIYTGKSFGSAVSSLRVSDGEHAILDLYCLALCGQFQGSRLSSFTAHVEYLRQAWAMSPSFQERVLRPPSVVFSFSLYGTNRKYTEGMLRNAGLITGRFPDAQIRVYCADDVPTDTITSLHTFPSVRTVPVKRLPGSQNMFDRFMAIDDPSCDVMIIRDADSRVNERDAACIEDFLASHKLLHIIRDHQNHDQRIMGGMWALRRALPESMASMIQKWTALTNRNLAYYGSDQQFLGMYIYPDLIRHALIHDDQERFRMVEPPHVPFRFSDAGRDFIGQAYDINEAGEDVAIY